MSEFFADPAVGGDNSRTTDDDNPTTGLGNGGFWTRLVPMFRNVVAIAKFVLDKASDVAQQSQVASNAAVTAVNAANSATAKATIMDTNAIVQGAADGSKLLRIDVSTLIPTNRTVTLQAPATNGVIATIAAVDERITAASTSSTQRARRQATALSL